MLMLIYCIVPEHPVWSQNSKLSLVKLKVAWLLSFADFGLFELPVACLGAKETR